MARLIDEIRKQQPFDCLEQEVFLNLLRTADVLGQSFDELFKSAGLSITQYNVLRILRGAGEPGLPCGEIAQRMISRDPDMTRLLDRLEARGLITRLRRGSDRRIVDVRISTAGLDMLAKLDEPVLAAHRRQLAHVGQDDLRSLVRLLETARSHVAH